MIDTYQQLYGEDYKPNEYDKYNDRLSGKNLSDMSHKDTTEFNSTNTMLVTPKDFRNRS